MVWTNLTSFRVLSASIVLLLLAMKSLSADSPRPFSIGTLKDVRTILPIFQELGDSHQVRRLIMPPILSLQADGKVICHLCKESPSFDLIKNTKTSENELTVTLVLKRDLSWGDGKALTRDDIKFTLENMALAPYPAGEKPLLPIRVIQFDENHEGKLTLVLRHRRSDANQLFAISVLPRHKAEQIKRLQANPDDVNLHLASLEDRAFSYGPYKVTKAHPNMVQLTQNSRNEWEGNPTGDFSIRIYPNMKEISQALKNSEIDQTLTRELNWRNLNELIGYFPQLKDRYELTSSPSFSQEILLLNLRSPLLVNPQLRQALYHAIDRQSIVTHFYQGLAQTSEGLVSPSIMQRMNEKRPVAFDMKSSEYLLTQAGWHLKQDGFRYGDNQQRLSLTLTCTEDRLLTPWHQQVQSDFKKVGIDLKVELVAESEYLKQTLKTRRFKDLACMRWSIPPMSAPLQLFHSLAIPSQDNDYSGQNYGGWDQPIVNRILENIMREYDSIHALRLYVRLEKQFQSEAPAIPLFYSPEITLIRKVQPNSATYDMQKNLSLFSDQLRRRL